MKIKKGFTLIELLAVIIILSIISLIGTFTISHVIDNVKKEAFKQNVRTLISSAENSFIISNFDKQDKNILFSNISNEQNSIELKNKTNYNYKINFFFEGESIKGYYSIDDKKNLSAYGEIPLEEININDNFIASNLVFFTDKGITLSPDTNIDFYKNLVCDNTFKEKGYITYEDFYAVGDGKTNDANAIYYAHECANKLNIPIKANKNTYYISHIPYNSFIKIKTDVNWNNSTFIIDDTIIDDTEKKQALFIVSSIDNNSSFQAEINLNYSSNTQSAPEIINYINSSGLDSSYYSVKLTSKNDKIYRATDSMTISQEFYKSDQFKINSNGTLLNDIRYNWNGPTTVDISEIPDKTLKLENVNFITLASNCEQADCKAIARNIQIRRANVELNNFNHYINNNDKPNYYGSGFIFILNTSDVTIKNSNFRAHMYKKQGFPTAGGTYDLSISNSSNIVFDTIGYTCNKNETAKDCYYKNMIDRNYFGITGNNNVKNWTIKNSILNRIDSHQPSQNISISSSILGIYSVNLTGEGTLYVENSSIDQAETFVNLRGDYGSTWNGNIYLNNIYFNTRDYKGEYPTAPRILMYRITNTFNLENNGFGYYLYVPSINASNIFINEDNLAKSMTEYHNKDYMQNSSGIILVQNSAKDIVNFDTEEKKEQRATLVGNMNFYNIRSDSFEKLKINAVFIGNDLTTTYINQNLSQSNPWGVDRVNSRYYKNINPIDINIDLTSLTNKSFTNYYKNTYYEYDTNNNLIEKNNDNAVNIITSSQEHVYCEIKANETMTDDWYTDDILHITLHVPTGYNIVDYGIGYGTNNYQKSYNMTIPSNKKGVFNIYGYIKDNLGNTYNCIKLIKKEN